MNYRRTAISSNCFELAILGIPTGLDVRMTLNNRLATAAPAIVQRMMRRKRPRVLRPVSPFRKGSIEVTTMIGSF